MNTFTRFRRFALPFVLLFFTTLAAAQVTTIRGRVVTQDKSPAVGANIYLRDTYDGATSDAEGNFSFDTEETGPQTLLVIYLGFDTAVQQVTLKGGVFEFNPVLKEAFNEMKLVVISAGSFEASDEKKVTVLKPLDIVTTASAGGDTYGALKTLPGTQVSSGDQEGLFVRGGTGSEAPTYIDGLLVRNPFFSSTPDYAARGRFNPFLFKGTVFSTGGYSALYGQGMSSALILDTQDLPDRSSGSLAVSSVGVGFGQLKLWKNKGRSAGININYTNLAPYFWLVKQIPDFSPKPEFVGTETFFRQKTKGNGMLKFYGYYNFGRVGFRTDSPETGEQFGFKLHNNNVYTNLSWAGLASEKWKINAGLSYSYDWNDISTSYNTGFLAPDTFGFRNSLAQARLVATRYLGRLTTLRFGSEYQYGADIFENPVFGSSRLDDHYSAVFAETDWYLTTRLVARTGLRGEYSALLDEARLSPRVSLAYKLGRSDQVSFAWGHFYQKGDSLLRWNNQYAALPGFQRAEHFILNYQYIYNDRTFRIEGFYKDYDRLVTTRDNRLDNDGDGYAQGIELFYRDKKTLPAIDFWVSYSWLDTKRRFQWYPASAQPTFAANHVVTLVGKKFFPKIRTGAGFTYSYSTGRPYYNPNRPESEFLADRTPDYHNLSLNLNYLATIKGAFTVFVLGVQNVLGAEQVFGYRYSADGATRQAITPAARRFFFVGAFASWGVDRRQEIIDNQN